VSIIRPPDQGIGPSEYEAVCHVHLTLRALGAAARLFIDADGRELLLTRAECALLRELANNPGQIRSRDDLRHAVAGRGADPCERSIDMLVTRLRQKIALQSKEGPCSFAAPAGGGRFLSREHFGNFSIQAEEAVAPVLILGARP
jgi:two-component system OmpR family response regulator